MARNKGSFEYSNNYEVKVKAPLDARNTVDSFNELTKKETWQTSNKSVWLYQGMTVSCKDRPGKLYQLKVDNISDEYTNPDNWVEVGKADNDKLNENLNNLRDVVYKNHIWCTISASPLIIYKGENNQITFTYDKGITGTDLVPNISFTKNGTAFSMPSNNTDITNNTTEYIITATYPNGVIASDKVTINAYNPIYVFGSDNENVTALPDVRHKEDPSDSPIGERNITINSTQYLCIAYPATMNDLINTQVSGFNAPFNKLNNIQISGYGEYKIYRSDKKQIAGTYKVTFI